MSKVQNKTGARRILAGWLFVLMSCLLVGCAKEEPVKLGFVGGLSGKVSDLGGPARNGMLLAVEEFNQAGGINDLPVQTIIKDDKQNKDSAVEAVRALLSENVDAIIGPVTSSMAVEVAQLATRAKTVMMGVTVTTNALTGLDDYFLRSLAPTAVHAAEVADFLYQKRGVKRFSAVYDLRNKAYTESWLSDFRKRFEALGGETVRTLSFTSGGQEELIDVAKKLNGEATDMVIFVTNAVDAALLAKLVRQEYPDMMIGTSEWAGTERLIELGGKFIEGAYVPQYLDRESTDPDYVAFRDNFLKRFNHEPGFPGMIAYNATNIVLQQLKDKSENQDLKQEILKQGKYDVIQGPFSIDQYGDAESKTFITQVLDSRFIVQND